MSQSGRPNTVPERNQAFTAGGERDGFVLRAGHGKAFTLRAGQGFHLTNPAGTQAVDLWSFAAADLDEHLSMEHFRSVNSTTFASMATPLVSNRRRPMLHIVEDTSAGRHDTLLCPCNAALYDQLGAAPGHRSCAGNLHEALAETGISIPFTPASLNLFMRVDVRADGSIDRRLPASRPGAHVRLRAAFDLIVVLSSCPQDITPINGADREPRDCIVSLDAMGDRD